MINLSENIKKSLQSNVNNYYLVYIIENNEKIYYLSTYPVSLPIKEGGEVVYFEDLVMKTGNVKESITLKNKKIKLSGNTLTINNASQRGSRFSDRIDGEMHGASIDCFLE